LPSAQVKGLGRSHACEGEQRERWQRVSVGGGADFRERAMRVERCFLVGGGLGSAGKIKASSLRSKQKNELIKQLEELKKELSEVSPPTQAGAPRQGPIND
jgi:hypothetical protein